MSKIANYDMFDYDYSTYWKKREYENLSEKEVLNNLLEGEKGLWFLDIGGSYGRLTSTYYDKYRKPIIIDYSLKTLAANKEILLSKYNNITLIAANAYKLPFADSCMDGGIMVRVLHHIEKPEEYFKEISRIFKNNAIYIQEFANKIHIKASLKALLKLNFDFFKTTPYKQPNKHNNEGTKEGVEGIFYNFHPEYIKENLKKRDFEILNIKGCSFLRSQFLKKIMSSESMLFFEKLFQATLSWTNFSPSIFLKTKYKGKNEEEKEYSDGIRSILVCPKCKKKLNFTTSDIALCKGCKREYQRVDGIWDFRIE